MSQKKEIKRSRTYLIVERSILIAFFVAVSLFLSYRYINETSGITILIHSHAKENIVQGNKSELLQGDKIKGEFQAKDNNIGIVAVRFNTFFRINGDMVSFKIKEKGSRAWFYEHSYLVNQFQPNKFFTFGFPIITDSKNKIYEFEIESQRGSSGDAVALSPIEPVFVTKYQYSKDRILSEQDYLVTFLREKLVNSLLDLNFLISLFVYSLPLIIYIIKVFFFDRYFADRYFFVFFPLVLMVMLCFANIPRSDEAVIGATGLWLFVCLAYQLESKISFILSLALIILTPIFLYLNLDDLSRNVAMWGYLLLVSGVVMQLIQIRSQFKK